MSEELAKEIAEKLKPGVYPNPDDQVNSLMPCGQCDGVIFFGEKQVAKMIDETHATMVTERSYEREAKRYLRAMPIAWKAMRLAMGRAEVGVSMPNVKFLITPEMKKLAEETGRPFKAVFTADKRSIFAAKREHRQRWQVFPVEEGVWAVLYI